MKTLKVNKMEKGNKLQEKLNQLGFETDGEDWDNQETDCVEKWEY